MTLFYLHFESGWMTAEQNYFIVRSQGFYMVVGWLWGMSLKRRTVGEHWAKRKKGLVVPYLWFSLLFLVLDIVLIAGSFISPQILYRDLYKTICLRGIGTLWFLPALLGGEMLFLSTRDKGWWLKIVLYGISFSLMCYYYLVYDRIDSMNHNLKEIINAPLRLLLDTTSAFLYISVAYYFSVRYGKRLFNTSKIKLFPVSALACLVAFYLGRIPEATGVAPMFLFVVRNIIAGFGALLLFRSIESFKPLSRPLAYFGKNSLTVMAMHWALLQVVLIIDEKMFHYPDYNGARTILYFLAALFALLGIIELINKKLRFILGK